MSSHGQKMIVLSHTGSTNSDALSIIRSNNAADGLAVFTHHQTAGRGRRDKRWKSAPGESIALSVIIRTEGIPMLKQPVLSMISALSVVELFRLETGVEASAKWPNDVYVHDAKLAGILIENIILGQSWLWSVCGFGVNINQTSFDTDIRGTSFFRETGKKGNPLELAERLHQIFWEKIQLFKAESVDRWIKDYNSVLYKKETRVKLQTGNRTFDAVIKGVSPQGRLITKDIFEREWNLDEVRIATSAGE